MQFRENTVQILYDGERTYEVSLDFYNAVLDATVFIIPALLPGAHYTAKMLLGAEFWSPLEQTDQQMAGRCVADITKHRKVPLRRVGCKHSHPARYELD